MKLVNVLNRLRQQKQRITDKCSFIPFKRMSEEKCMSAIRDSGYVFAPLWQELEPLKQPRLPLSIIIPVYNSEKFLSYCLESILCQDTTYAYEVICVDDESTDSSLLILNQYKEKFPDKLRIVAKKHGGISAARNCGIVAAKGEYVGFMDNDDTVEPSYVTQILDIAYKSNADMVQTGFLRVNPQGLVLSTECISTCVINEENDRERLGKVHGYIWGGLIRKQIFENVRFPLGFWYEDMITRLLLMNRCKTIAILGTTPYHYLVHDSNASKVLWKKQSVKTADQYWLARSLVEFQIHELGVVVNDSIYEVLLEEFGHMLWWRTLFLAEPLRRTLFLLAGFYLRSLHFSYKTGDEIHKSVNAALLGKNYFKWLQVASINA